MSPTTPAFTSSFFFRSRDGEIHCWLAFWIFVLFRRKKSLGGGLRQQEMRREMEKIHRLQKSQKIKNKYWKCKIEFIGEFPTCFDKWRVEKNKKNMLQ